MFLKSIELKASWGNNLNLKMEFKSILFKSKIVHSNKFNFYLINILRLKFIVFVLLTGKFIAPFKKLRFFVVNLMEKIIFLF